MGNRSSGYSQSESEYSDAEIKDISVRLAKEATRTRNPSQQSAGMKESLGDANGIRAGQECTLTIPVQVQAKDVIHRNLAVIFVFPNKMEEDLKYTQADDGNLDVTFMSRSTGSHNIVVKRYGEGEVVGSPFQVYIDATHPKQDKKCNVAYSEHKILYTKRIAQEKERKLHNKEVSMKMSGSNKVIVGQELGFVFKAGKQPQDQDEQMINELEAQMSTMSTEEMLEEAQNALRISKAAELERMAKLEEEERQRKLEEQRLERQRERDQVEKEIQLQKQEKERKRKLKEEREAAERARKEAEEEERRKKNEEERKRRKKALEEKEQKEREEAEKRRIEEEERQKRIEERKRKSEEERERKRKEEEERIAREQEEKRQAQIKKEKEERWAELERNRILREEEEKRMKDLQEQARKKNYKQHFCELVRWKLRDKDLKNRKRKTRLRNRNRGSRDWTRRGKHLRGSREEKD